MRLNGKAALVTGAAHGIGRGIVQAFVREGARVLATDIDPEGLAETARLVKCETLVADAASPDDWAGALAHARQIFGGLQILVNNATWFARAPLTELSEADWHRTLDVGLTSVFLGMKVAIPLMEAGGGGAVVNISSMNQVRFNPGFGAYAAMKAGLSALTQQAALEYGPRGIRCNAISPGFIETERTRYPSVAEYRLNLEAYPVGRVGNVADVAMAAVFLASDEAGFITGVDLLVDGGTTLGAVAAYLKPSLRSAWRPGRVVIEEGETP
ncbi:MAG TPA: SDR family oxidoreductase [Symbiobacteriaceae bacterium]|nr:SDR family oxidoreductase [Symbiobacteriaceae bacterium]